MIDKIPYEAFFALYLIIASNYIGDLFSCKFRELLSSSMLIKHFIGIIIFGFLVVLSGINLEEDNAILNGVLITIILYIWFLLTTRTHAYVTLLIVMLFLIMYIISYRIKYLKEQKKSAKKLELINKYILIISGIITLLGVLNYGYLKRREVKSRNEKFSIYKFLVGNVICRNDKIDTFIAV